MTAPPNYRIRRAEQTDEPFLWEMLYQSLYVREGREPFPRDVLGRSEVARYVKGWGREHDTGFIAVDSNTDESIGAVWMRLFPEDERGFAYVGDETPELGIAVLPGHRGRGVGTELLGRLIETARGLYPALALSVSAENPAVHLYRRMGFETIDVQESALVMKRKLSNDDAG